MKAKIKTEVLKEAVSKVVKGAGNNKLIPITSLMEIAVDEKAATLTTTDMVHFVSVSCPIEEETEKFSVVIEADRFAKLVSKMTSQYIEFSVTNNFVSVSGNGNYTLDIPLDENGENITYPKPKYEVSESYEVKKSILELVSSVCGASVAKTLEVPVYTNYYLGEEVLATDTYAISSVNLDLFNGKKVLFPAELVQLFAIIDDEAVKVEFSDNNKVVFSANNVKIVGQIADGLDEYAVDAIGNLVKQEFDSVCKFKRSAMLSALERVALFVGPYDDSAVKLVFTEKGISIESKKSTGIEVIDYISNENYQAFSCMINVNMLIDQLKVYNNDEVTMEYGADNSVKLKDGLVTQVIALLEQ